MMAEGGELAAIGRTPELMDVIARHGDRAMDFVWRNKAPLAATAGLTAFLANPEPYLDGTNKLAGTVAREVIQPVVHEAADTISDAMWSLMGVSSVAVAAVTFLAVRHPKVVFGLLKLAVAGVRRKGGSRRVNRGGDRQPAPTVHREATWPRGSTTTAPSPPPRRS